MAAQHPVYIIHSNWSLPTLDRFLSGYGTVGFLRIMYDANRKETKRSLAILPVESYEALIRDGYGKTHRNTRKGFAIAPYHLVPGTHPVRSLFIPIPSEFLSDESAVLDTVRDKMVHLEEWGIVPARSWKLHVPLRSRELGTVVGACFLSFSERVTIQDIAMVRVLLSDTYWPAVGENDSVRSFFQCFWSRRDRGDRGVRKDGKGRKDRKDQPNPKVTRIHTRSSETSVKPTEGAPKPSSVSLPASSEQPAMLP